jgi:hypothetical protein
MFKRPPPLLVVLSSNETCMSHPCVTVLASPCHSVPCLCLAFAFCFLVRPRDSLMTPLGQRPRAPGYTTPRFHPQAHALAHALALARALALALALPRQSPQRRGAWARERFCVKSGSPVGSRPRLTPDRLALRRPAAGRRGSGGARGSNGHAPTRAARPAARAGSREGARAARRLGKG